MSLWVLPQEILDVIFAYAYPRLQSDLDDEHARLMTKTKMQKLFENHQRQLQSPGGHGHGCCQLWRNRQGPRAWTGSIVDDMLVRVQQQDHRMFQQFRKVYDWPWRRCQSTGIIAAFMKEAVVTGLEFHAGWPPDWPCLKRLTVILDPTYFVCISKLSGRVKFDRLTDDDFAKLIPEELPCGLNEFIVEGKARFTGQLFRDNVERFGKYLRPLVTQAETSDQTDPTPNHSPCAGYAL